MCIEEQSSHGCAWRNRVVMDVHEEQSSHGCALRNRVVMDVH